MKRTHRKMKEKIFHQTFKWKQYSISLLPMRLLELEPLRFHEKLFFLFSCPACTQLSDQHQKYMISFLTEALFFLWIWRRNLEPIRDKAYDCLRFCVAWLLNCKWNTACFSGAASDANRNTTAYLLFKYPRDLKSSKNYLLGFSQTFGSPVDATSFVIDWTSLK
jgi:hypothetical protein